jgi:acetyl esterase/lipase
MFLHGGGDRDTWKPEVPSARTYADRSGMTVFYPIHAPMTEASIAATADYLHLVYQQILSGYGPGRVAVVGGSYGGFLAVQLITWINRNQQCIAMPSLVVLNSPFAFPETQEEMHLLRQANGV